MPAPRRYADFTDCLDSHKGHAFVGELPRQACRLAHACSNLIAPRAERESLRPYPRSTSSRTTPRWLVLLFFLVIFVAAKRLCTNAGSGRSGPRFVDTMHRSTFGAVQGNGRDRSLFTTIDQGSHDVLGVGS
eukprot:364809-Chlamydomonas_euryale.AAC.14